MTGYRSVAAVTAAISLLTVVSAEACPVYLQPRLADARQADAVVVGYVTAYRRELSPAGRASIEKWLANNPGASREHLRDIRSSTDRARITVEVDHAIAGEAPSTITVYWYRMTNNGPPESMRGGYLFALRKNPSSTTSDAAADYAVMQGICTGAIVFRRGSSEANAIREMFGLWPEPLEVPRKALAESFRDPSIPWPTLIVYGLLAVGSAAIGLVAFWPRRRRPQSRP